MILIDSELYPVGFWDTMEDSEYKNQNEIKYSWIPPGSEASTLNAMLK
jgi:hypothetical protein